MTKVADSLSGPSFSMHTGFGERVFPLALDSLVRGIGRWALTTIDTAPGETPGWRDIVWNRESKRMEWRFPWSNAAERIEALLWLHRVFDQAQYLRAARHYADRMIADTHHGIYRGADAADGMAWYWRECDTLMTNYTIRIPPAFFALAKATGDPRYRDAAIRSGESLLRLQTDIGLFYEGLIPESLPKARRDEAQKWVSRTKINSRIGYVFYTLASLAVETGEARWSAAMERFASGFLPLQRPDGSFAEEILVQERGELSSLPKGHFHSYILYGMARALCLLGGNADLLQSARSLAEYMLAEVTVSGAHFYGDSRVSKPGESHEWRSATYEATAGFAWLFSFDGDARCRDAARYLVIQAAQRQVSSASTEKDIAGGVLGFNRWDLQIAPFVQGFLNFWLLLGCEALVDNDWKLNDEGTDDSRSR